MIKRKRIAVLGVSLLAALGLMSVSAAGAQAGNWTINGKALLSGSASFESAGGTVTITGGGITFKCAEQKGAGSLWYGGNATSNILLSGCVVLNGLGEVSEACLIKNEKISLQAEMLLSTDGSKVLFRKSGVFGYMGLISVEEECSLFVGPEQAVQLDGEFTATVGSPAVKLPLSISSSKFFVGIWGMENSEIKGSSSMWLTGANAGKVLGTTSS